MKLFTKAYQYLGMQPIGHLWASTLVFLACFVVGWYTLAYRPLLCALHNMEERLSLCTKTCEQDMSHASLNYLEDDYKTKVALLNDYKGNSDAQSFYHGAIDELLKVIAASQCTLLSFSSQCDTTQSLYQLYQATLVCQGTVGRVSYALSSLAARHIPWRSASVTLAKGHDDSCQLSLGLQCLVL